MRKDADHKHKCPWCLKVHWCVLMEYCKVPDGGEAYCTKDECQAWEATRLKNTKYSYIRAWGKFMSSTKDYIEQEVAIAAADDAPEDAIWKKQDGTWATYRDITSESTKEEVDKCLKILLS